MRQSRLRAIVLLATLSIVGCDGAVAPLPPPLTAEVRFNGAQFTVKNAGPDPWFNVAMTLNGDFKLSEGDLAPNQTWTAGALQFARSDGTRFNPYQMKPLRFAIVANSGSANGPRSSYAGTFSTVP